MSNVCMISFGDLAVPRNGYVLRCWMLAQKLVRDGHTVTVYQYSGQDAETEREGITIKSIGVKHERPGNTSLLARMAGFDPLKELLFPIEGYLKLKKHRHDLAKYDEFYIEGCMLTNAMRVVRPLGKKLVVDTHCMNKDVALKLKKHKKFQGALRAFIWHQIENRALNRADEVIAISDIDKAFMQQHYHIAPDRIVQVPHVVDPAALDKYAGTAETLRTELISGGNKLACFIGDLGAIQNVESEKYIREQLAPRTPDITYVLVGNNPRGLKSHGNIVYTGFVEAIDPYVIMADVCIAPMAVGSGVKTKVLDYLKYDKLIVATPIAVEGIEPSSKTRVCELKDFLQTLTLALETK